MINLKPIRTKEKCKGQAEDGTLKCAYRERCARFMRPDGDMQVYSEFYKAGDDCPQYESLQASS